MGRRGPLPQSPELQLLRGDPGRHGSTPTPQRLAVKAAPNPPSWISREAKAEWRRVTPELSRLNIISNLDRAILSSYVEAWSIAVAARREIGDSATIQGQRTKGERVKSPAMVVYVQATTLMVSLAKELGLTPYSRMRMANPTDPELEDTSDLDD
jgi:P27 family predicted phage terminase small subunit